MVAGWRETKALSDSRWRELKLARGEMEKSLEWREQNEREREKEI